MYDMYDCVGLRLCGMCAILPITSNFKKKKKEEEVYSL